MELKQKSIFKSLIFIPAIISFLLALIPTLAYQWPLSQDIIYHIHVAQVYASYGFVINDPLIHGAKIVYPPLFRFLLAFLGIFNQSDYFQIARFLQPFLAMLVVLSVSYVTKKLYGDVAGISAGFLMLSSYIYYRLILPLPETFTLIFFPLAIYFYYLSIEKKMYKYALISGIILIMTALTHQAAALCLFSVLTITTFVVSIFSRDIKVFINYGIVLLVGIIVSGLAIATSIFWYPHLLSEILNIGSALIGSTGSIGFSLTLDKAIPMDTIKFLGSFGVLVLIFACFGAIISLKKRLLKDIFVISWIITLLFLAYSYLFGINVITYRLIIYLLLPLSILGGFGLSYLYTSFKKETFPSIPIRTIFLLAIFTLSVLFGVVTVESQKIAIYGAETEYGYIQIAPPSSSEIELSKWFNENGDKKSYVMINNLYTGYFLVATSKQPILGPIENEKMNSLQLGGYVKSDVEKIEKTVGYIVYDKRLNSYPPRTFGELIYYPINNQPSIINNTHKVYENENYIIWKVGD